MRYATCVAVVLLALLAGCACPTTGGSAETGTAPRRYEAELIISFPIQGEFGVPVEPSGLTFYDGFLYTVSDEHDGTVFKLVMTVDTHAGEADLELIGIPVEFTPAARMEGMDFEGIASDREGGFYILSEEYARVFHMDLQDPTSRPVTPSLVDRGKAVGLFREGSAGFEGIACDGEKLILCAERQPRAIVEFPLSSAADPHLQVQDHVQTRSAFPQGADADFAGLFSMDAALYVLERSAYTVCRLRKVNGQYVAEAALAYGKAIDEHNLRYQRKERETIDYGRGEGLALDAERVYIMLDNNGRPLKDDPKDARARLLVLRRPEGF